MSTASPFPLLQVGTFLAAAGALFVSLHKRTRSSVTQVARRLTQRVTSEPPRPPSPPPAAGAKLYLRGVSGPYQGQKIPLAEKPCILGRDPQVANLVFPADSPHISKRHCQVYCDSSGRAWIEDSWSSNGTFTAAGTRIASGKPQELRKGERFYLGKPDASFEVIAE